MVNTEAFGKRIEKIMNHYSISASSFADAMGVGRSSISHILSGRNKPSLDFVMRIIEAYPEVSLQWLLYNEGTFPLSSNMKISETSVPSSSTPPENAAAQEIEQDLFSNSDDVLENENEESTTETKETPLLQKTENDERIDKIVIFYKDGTFLSYTPK
ncbi:MAG: transcriptional regulator [Aquimarina sp.]|nr:transcriptional regulator [Aquimarina sp.]